VSVNPRLTPHPQPNLDRLNREPLPKHLLRGGSVLYRIHTNPFNAIYYSLDDDEQDRHSRFNDPQRKYGVMYAALDEQIALRETVSLTDFRIVIVENLQKQCLSELSLLRDLILVDLSGSGLARIGADSRLTTLTNEDYQIPQAWSRAFYEHPDNVDGIYYRSRYDPSGLCVALFEGRIAKRHLREQRVTKDNLLDQSFDRNLQRFLDRYGYERDDSENP
jgi:RES domain